MVKPSMEKVNEMADKTEITEGIALMLILVICLALTPNIITSLVDAKYGLEYIDNIEKTGGAASVTITLTHGNARNESGYITATLNVTDKNGHTTLTFPTDFYVSDFGSYTTGTTITLTTLNDTVEYLVTVDYDYLIPAIQCTLLNLVPLFWVVAIVACTVAFVSKKLHMW